MPPPARRSRFPLPAGALLLLALLPGSGCGPLAAVSSYFSVEPAVLYLPGALAGAPGHGTVVLANLGEVPLEVRRLHLGVSTGFAVESPPLPLVLRPGQSLAVAVRHVAGPGVPRSTVLEVESSDPDRPLARVELVAPPTAPLLVAEPRAVDFAAVDSNATVRRQVLLRNVGLAIASGVSLEWPEPAADFTATLAATDLAPGGVLPLTLSYAPRGGDADRAVLRVRWSEGSLTISLTGRQDLAPLD